MDPLFDPASGFGLVWEALPANAALLDDRGRVVAVNEAWRAFGRRNGLRSPDGGLGWDYLALCEAAGAEPGARETLEGLQGLLAGRLESFQLSYPCDGSGERRWYKLRASRSQTGGRVWGILLHEPITAEKLEAEAAIAAEARLASILDACEDAIYGVSPVGRILSWNPAARRLFGYTSEEAIGRHFHELVPPERRSELEGHCERLQHGERVVAFETERLHKDGHRIPLLITLSAIRGAGGEIRGYSAIARDLSELIGLLEARTGREAEMRDMRELSRLKDHFLSTLSHEMRTPLSMIIGYTELLEERYPHEELLAGIAEGGRRLREHIDHMLDYSALLSGSLPLYLSEVFVGEILEAALTALQPDLEVGRLEPELEIVEPLPCLKADPRRLQQVIIELLDNARKHSSPGGRLGVRAEAEGGGVRILVWDTGKGIAPEARARIWEGFGQAELGDAVRLGGLGLGLTIAKQLVELHGGRLELVSTTEGAGSCFAIHLPASACEA